MILDENENKLFFKLYPMLMVYGNQWLGIFPTVNNLPKYFKLNNNKKVEIREGVYEQPEIFEDFIEENLFKLSEFDLAIIKSWKKYKKCNFIILKHYKSGSIFYKEGKDRRAYNVYGLTNELREIFPQLPIYVGTVLLPFNNKIIIDGLFSVNNIIIGPNMTNDYNELLKEIKNDNGIISTISRDE